MWFEFSAEVTGRIEEAERGNIPVLFYNLKSSCYQGIHSCEGDLIVICNALSDYADLLIEFIEQSEYEGYKKAFYEVHAERCRKISEKLQEQIGYNREEAIERCQKKKGYYGQGGTGLDNGVGEDALVMMVKKSREKKGENHGREDIRGDDDRGDERAGEEPTEDERI